MKRKLLRPVSGHLRHEPRDDSSRDSPATTWHGRKFQNLTPPGPGKQPSLQPAHRPLHSHDRHHSPQTPLAPPNIAIPDHFRRLVAEDRGHGHGPACSSSFMVMRWTHGCEDSYWCEYVAGTSPGPGGDAVAGGGTLAACGGSVPGPIQRDHPDPHRIGSADLPRMVRRAAPRPAHDAAGACGTVCAVDAGGPPFQALHHLAANLGGGGFLPYLRDRRRA
jgi:hypothetical protein